MKRLLAKILLCIAVGPLLGHQLVSHSHNDDLEVLANHDDHDADHHQDHFPYHNIAHIYSFDQDASVVQNAKVFQIDIDAFFEFVRFHLDELNKPREYFIGRPPLIGYDKYFSLRAPPSLS